VSHHFLHSRKVKTVIFSVDNLMIRVDNREASMAGGMRGMLGVDRSCLHRVCVLIRVVVAVEWR
jgi:hypothetical protein